MTDESEPQTANRATTSKADCPDHDTADLTRREREILFWIANGKSYWETAQILGIAEGTVRIHLSSIRKKLDASNTTNAVAKALFARKIAFHF
jgi:LuxR family quorum-sensing system transcriptional regulator SinR